MKTRDFFRCTAKPLKIFIMLSILIFIVLFFELIFFLTVRAYQYKDPWRSLYEPPQGRQWDIKRSQKCFLPDGTVILVGSKDNKRSNISKKMEMLYDANYTPLWEGAKKDRPDSYNYLEWAKGKGNEWEKRYLHDMQKVSPPMSRALEIPVRRNDKVKEVWRYLPDEDFFIGYEFEGDEIGYIGVNGFIESKTDAEPFGQFNILYGIMPFEYETPVVIWQTDKRVFTIDFENRKTEILIDSGDKKILELRFKNWSFVDNDSPQESKIKYQPMIQYKTDDDKYHLILFKPDQRIALNIPEQWEKYYRNTIMTTDSHDGIFLYHSTTNILKPKGYKMFSKVWTAFRKTVQSKKIPFSAELYGVDNDGDISIINTFDWIRPEFEDNRRGDIEEQLLTYATIVSPTVFHPLYTAILHFPDDALNKYDNDMTSGYLMLIVLGYPRNLTVNIALSVLMMAIVLWHGRARRTSGFGLICWIVFAGLFNLAGLLTYLALNHTALIKCSACGKS